MYFQLAAIQRGETVAMQHLGGVIKLGGELHASGASADNTHRQLGVLATLRVAVAQEGVEHVVAKRFGLPWAIEKVAVLGNARGTEVIGNATQGQHQVVVFQYP